MMNRFSIPEFGTIAIVVMSLTLAAYFCFSAVQGEYGVLARAEYDAEGNSLQTQLADLKREIASLENKTRRLSDDFLDLDLLDEQARDVLGLIRMDEVVLQ